MINRLYRFVLRVAVPAILLGCGIAAHADIILSTTTPLVTVGSTFDLEVRATDINLGGYQLLIGFQPLLSPLDSISFDNYLGAPLSFVNSQLLIDSIELDEVSFADASELQALQGDALSGNTFSLARLTFLAAQPGKASFTFLSSVLTDPAGSEISSGLVGTAVDIQDAGPPSAVPEPATWILLASSLGALALVRRRRIPGADRRINGNPSGTRRPPRPL